MIVTFGLIVITVIAFLYSTHAIFKLKKTGMELAGTRNRIRGLANSSFNIRKRELLLEDVAFGNHGKALFRYFASQTLAVTAIEGVVMNEGGRWVDFGVFNIHMFFVVAFVINFLLMLVFNGTWARKAHGYLAAPILLLYGCMALTGIFLVCQLVYAYVQ